MQQLTIRRAVREDCPQLMELVRELAVYEKAPEQVTVTDMHFEESGFGPNPVWWALVAVVPDAAAPEGEKILGFALYYVRYSTWKGQAMYLEDLLVTEEARGQGIGFALFKALEQEAADRGWNRIVWQVLDWNEPAINFYRKLQANMDPEWINCTKDLPS